MNVHTSSNTLPELDGFLSTFDLKFRRSEGKAAEAWATLKKVGDVRADIEAVMPQAPALQSASRYVEFFGGLTFGDALDSQLSVLLKEVCAFEAIPTWLAGVVDL